MMHPLTLSMEIPMKISEILLADGVPLVDVAGVIYSINREFCPLQSGRDKLLIAHDHWDIRHLGQDDIYLVITGCNRGVLLDYLKEDFFASESACRAEAKRRLVNAIACIPV